MPFLFRRRPLAPRFCRVPIDGNRKLHAMPEDYRKVCYYMQLFSEINKLLTFIENHPKKLESSLKFFQSDSR